MTKTLAWIDVGTHFGQEYRAAFGSKAWFFYKFVRRFIAAYVLRQGDCVTIGDFLQALYIKRTHLVPLRSYSYVCFVEANPKVLSHPVYREANSVYCVALGGAEQCRIGTLFYGGRREISQSSSIFAGKNNVDLTHSDLVTIVSPTYFAQSLKERLMAISEDYEILLRINCEGSEDEVIYAFKSIFGDPFRHVFGSLKDVKGVKGEKAYDEMIAFMECSQIEYTIFSSNVNTWLAAFKKLQLILAD